MTRSIQQSYHAAQVQVLAQARDLLMSADPRAEPVVVGQPLPLDADFLTRTRDNKAQVCGAVGTQGEHTHRLTITQQLTWHLHCMRPFGAPVSLSVDECDSSRAANGKCKHVVLTPGSQALHSRCALQLLCVLMHALCVAV